MILRPPAVREVGVEGGGEMMYAKSLWLCPACCTPVWVDWERGMFLCPECDQDLWEVETEQGEGG